MVVCTGPIVAVEGLSHRYGALSALDGLTLTIERGDVYGLLGLNGAGKTTTIRILLGLLRPTSGVVTLFGRRLGEDRLSICGRIGAIVESPAFYPHLTGRTNLELLYRLAGRGSSAREEPNGAWRDPEEVLGLVGLTEAADRPARKYSAGMLQRLYLAQALLCRPELLILDEPTSNLDPKGIMEVRDLIRRLNQEEGVTVLLSSHQLSEAEGLCNRVMILHRGRKVVESDLKDLLADDQCRVEITSDSPERTIDFLREVDWCSEVKLIEGRAVVKVPHARRGELNSLLVRNDFTIHEFVARRSTLEDHFHERIAEYDS